MAESSRPGPPAAHFQPAPALELAFALAALLHPAQRPFAVPWAAAVAAGLTPPEQAHLERLRRLPEALWLADFALYQRCLADGPGLAPRLAALDADAFAAAMVGDEVPLAEVAALRRDPQGPRRLARERPWLWGGREGALALILHDTAALQAAYTALLPRVWELGVAPMLPRLERLWAAALAQAQAEAAGVDPPEFARRVFTRPFGRRFGPGHVFRHYVFAPSYFVSPLRVALFDPELAVLTLDARLGPWAMEQARARLLDGLRAVAEENRLEMLRLLMKDPGHGAWIARRLKLKPATVTHHLALLRRAGLVTETEGPPGAVRYHRTDRAAVQGLIRLLTDYLDDALETDTEPGGHDDAGSH